MGAYPNGVSYRGINRAGAEYGDDWDGWTGQTFYTFPTEAELDSELAFYGNKGFNTIRLPISWERLQQSLSGPLEVLTGTLNSAAIERITRSARCRSLWTSPVEETKTRTVLVRRRPVSIAPFTSGIISKSSAGLWKRRARSFSRST